MSDTTRLGDRAPRPGRQPARSGPPRGATAVPLPDSGVHARLAARARAVRRRPRRLALGGVAVLVLLGLVLWLLLASPVVVVRRVVVAGVPEPERRTYASAAQVPLGTPVLRLDEDRLVARLTARREVASASVDRGLTGTVTLRIQKRTAVLAVRNPQGQVQVVDSSGVSFGTVARAPRGVPLATASSAAGLEGPALRAALAAMSVIPPAVRSSVSRVTVSSASLVTFKVGMTSVVWGGEEQPDRKAAVLQVLLRQKPRPSMIDVSAPNSPVTR